jgi:uncharacterized membrane protein YeaQ/YmgE (transglycosylase-associated protein family)
MNFGEKALQVLRTVAPTLAMGALGPFGPLAASAISLALGTSATDPKAAETALLTATPDQLLALRKAENDFQIQIKTLGISEEKLSFDDTANARAREIAVKDSTPHVLAYGITIGFFGILAYLLWNGKPPGGDVIMVMLGALGSAWAGVISYYFGSSASSQKKDSTISNLTKGAS